MKLGDTIVALASAPGRSRRAIVRLSGPAASEVARAARIGPSRGAHHGRLRMGAHECPVLILRMNAPASYTGEDALEIQCPGSPALVTRIVESLLAFPGVRHAEPGEFSARAFLAGRLTLDQAEGVAATIAAHSAGQLSSARALLAGVSGALYRDWTSRVAHLLALVEAGVDFTDQEDVVPIAPRDLALEIESLRAAIASDLGGKPAEWLTGRPRVALAGRPNAGKSTLFNALLGRDRAVTSPTPGSTRDAIVETLDLSREVPGAGEIELIDLAGLDTSQLDATEINPPDAGSNAQVIHHAAQARARAELSAASVILHCDPRGLFDPAELPPGIVPALRIRTKADRSTPLAGPEDLAVCALDGWNLPELRARIAAAAWGSVDEALVIVPRHRRTLTAAFASLAEARDAFDASKRALTDPEIVAQRLRLALDLLGEIAGRISPDEVLGRIFAGFCIGK